MYRSVWLRAAASAGASGGGKPTSGSNSSGGWSSIFRAGVNRLEGKHQVGMDKTGNRYFIDASQCDRSAQCGGEGRERDEARHSPSAALLCSALLCSAVACRACCREPEATLGRVSQQRHSHKLRDGARRMVTTPTIRMRRVQAQSAAGSSQLSSLAARHRAASSSRCRHHWLRHGRAVPPTLAELEADEARSAALAAKVKALNEADRKLRLQEMAQRALEGTGPRATATLERDDLFCQQRVVCSQRVLARLARPVAICCSSESAASLENLSRERDQHGGVGSWSQDKQR